MFLSPIPAEPVHTLSNEPAWLAVSLDDLKLHLGLPAEDATRDTELQGFVLAATRAVEAYADIIVRATTVTALMETFAPRFRLVKRPFAALTRIDYIEAETGEIKTVPASTFHVQRTGQFGAAVVLGRDRDWPDVAARLDAVQAIYTAGWADPDLIPADIRHAILMTAAKLEANRGDCGCDGGGAGGSVYAMKNARPSVLPEAASLLLQPFVYVGLTVA